MHKPRPKLPASEGWKLEPLRCARPPAPAAPLRRRPSAGCLDHASTHAARISGPATA